ncbi:uncharacterized protein LACBIDRAFT_302853 [Laccaria bicolor S238N-H82]|uniref:Nuclear pore complex protein Nup85 n=1 Tax=Laccaria bicolor (strain S238N-H82 / ATCC MYA-4686) TaxID=486041 RepID=B0DIG2_LACBS|nr:uncharacterized protein LACBIDRAFT_302853 [Laccaria bicolor S238N-H82]EDR05684.1 predicted protein [Laccaria bicolor S238N-H82]|eukprot:XP_001883788.1 predicted protein [Laccaria bicolor S238N-H82]
MSSTENLNLLPPLIESGRFHQLVKAGQTISSSFSPLDNSFSAFITYANTDIPSKEKETKSRTDEEQPIYFSGIDIVPSSERRLFITDTLIIFAAFNNLLLSAENHPVGWLQDDNQVKLMRKLAIDYVNFIKECWVHASQPIPRPEGPLQFSSDHYRSLYTCFSLFVVLYIPEPGYDLAPVGDELMEWLNIHFIEPSTEEGDHLSALEKPWEDESFWPYLTRAILRGLTKSSAFFLGTLLRHESEDLQRLTTTLESLVGNQPRLQEFNAERDFAFSFRRWKDKVKALRIEMDEIPEDRRFDEFDNWWDRLSNIVGILEGRFEVIKRVCEDLGGDWKEVCVAWSIFVDPRMQRQHLPDVVSQVLGDTPPDPTNLEDMIHAALFSGRPAEGLRNASQLDRWLAAHLASIMAPLQLIDAEDDEDADLSTRDEHVLSYADYLHSDPALWRVTVEYMYSCGDVGKDRADEILLRVPLRLQEQNFEEIKIRAGDVVGVLKDVNQTCFQHKREAVRRSVCRIAAQTLVQKKDYGLAVSYCISAEDWVGLGSVVDRVLDEYIINGPQIFSQYAVAIAPSAQKLQTPQGHGLSVHRLVFTVQYAHLHELFERHEYQEAANKIVAIFSQDIVPKSWWAIVLCDAVQLLESGPSLLFSSSSASFMLQKLNEIFVRTSQGSGDDYLIVLSRKLKGGGETEALENLRGVRLALARYFARCTVFSAQ